MVPSHALRLSLRVKRKKKVYSFNSLPSRFALTIEKKAERTFQKMQVVCSLKRILWPSAWFWGEEKMCQVLLGYPIYLTSFISRIMQTKLTATWQSSDNTGAKVWSQKDLRTLAIVLSGSVKTAEKSARKAAFISFWCSDLSWSPPIVHYTYWKMADSQPFIFKHEHLSLFAWNTSDCRLNFALQRATRSEIVADFLLKQ